MIHWITESLGTASATDQSLTEGVVLLDVRDLVDKSGNSTVAVREKIDQGLALLRQGKRVVICCDYGISRSNAIAAGIISRLQRIRLNQAIKEVFDKIGRQEIKLELLQSVRNALQDVDIDCPDGEFRVLLTGGTGFIGQALLPELSKRHYVIAPSKNEVNLIAGALELDMLAKEHRVNCLIHLANPRVYTSNQAMGETLTILRNVLDICKENNLRLVYPSSWEVFSAYKAGEIIADENLPLFPKGPFGETKLLCENLINNYFKLYDLKYIILRSSLLYGEASNRPKFIYNFISKARKNEQIKTHHYLNGEPKLDLLYIRDFISAILAAVETNFTGSLNIGAGRVVSTRKIAEMIINKTNSCSTIDHLIIEDYVANITPDISLAREILSWQPMLTWESGISRLLEN
jgi:nucleoside-diphosphate-sugar epimerase